ncbi:MAG: ATP-grasp domain-containing protein [Bdellovibrionales bacterium]|nr:ATP-grasp domain-containing protein [Bdellovibrionales bacterium]
MRGKVIVVDAYSSGNLLAPEFKRRFGLRADHVQSTREIWPILRPSFFPEHFERNFPFDNNFAELVTWAREAAPLAVIAGTETGVELADQLSEALGLATSNGTTMSPARRDKFLMIEACRSAGLKVAQQIKAKSWDEVSVWLAKTGLKKIVVKPLKSAWTDSVVVTEDFKVAKQALENIVGTVNKLGIQNEFALVQEFLPGVEHVLNSVSSRGRHYVTDMWKYQKRSLHGYDAIYDTDILLSGNEASHQQMQSYLFKVLDALQIVNGAAHAEVMLTPEGPALVEIGARMDGLSFVELNRRAVGFSALDLVCEAYLEPAAFEKRLAQPFQLKEHARIVYLTCYQSGVLKSIPGEKRLRALKSLFSLRFKVNPGDPITPTTSFFNTPGFLTLINADPAELLSEYEFIRKFEKQDLFEVGS